METDCIQNVRKCYQCQIHADMIKVPPNKLNATSSPWPFAAWGMDVIGPIKPTSSNGHRFILVAIDYFTKWIEGASYKVVTKKVAAYFFKDRIVCQFGVLESIITDNAANFNSDLMKAIEVDPDLYSGSSGCMVCLFPSFQIEALSSLHSSGELYRFNIEMAPSEAFYGRQCCSPIGWFEPGEARLCDTDLAKDVLDKVKLIQEQLRIAQSMQKSCTDQKACDLSFMVGEKEFHSVFHMSMLWRYHADRSHVSDYSTVQLDKSLVYEEELVDIVDSSISQQNPFCCAVLIAVAILLTIAAAFLSCCYC
ncbi:uncharacterized protein [Nicotiana sylvestris]|uniref:uncharacterized protein n=1 Tax=Nicotiana sylvestris TaxID=4096 RepID=UPI00388C69DA